MPILSTETLTSCIVLKADDVNDYDMLITALTTNLGKIKFKLKGVRKQNAKLKFLSQPFCFADITLCGFGKNYVCVSASLKEPFFDIVANMEKLYGGYIILELIDGICSLNASSTEKMFVTLLNCLKEINFCGEDELLLVLAKSVQMILKVEGFKLQLENCSKCGKPLSVADEFVFSGNGGGIACEDCIEIQDKTIKMQTFVVLKAVSDYSIQELKELKMQMETTALIAALNAYSQVYSFQCDKTLKSIGLFFNILKNV